MLGDILNHVQEYLILYAPLGAIGAWRWGVWLWQKIVSFWYRQIPPLQEENIPSFSVITPVYNEDPELFNMALYSWAANGPAEIIAVIDYSDKKCIAVFEEFSTVFDGARLIITDKPGKRPALGKGIKAAKENILALVDSDTLWSPDLAKFAFAPFQDQSIGGVATRQAVLDPRTLAEILFAIRLDLRYLHEFSYLSVVSDALTCLSGRTAIYRKEALLPIVDQMVNEKFLGKLCISGEDKRLTSLVQADGWKVRYQQDAIVYTPGAPKLSTFFSQNLRWSRNSWRTDIQTFFSAWVWKRELFFTYHLFDRAIQPFTLLIGPIYMIFFLAMREWTAAIILASWWILSRTIKLFPHLKYNPQNILVIPLFVIAQFILAVQKIYALFSLDYHSWITRWDQFRIQQKKNFSLLPSRLATFAVVGGMAFFLIHYQYIALQNSQIVKEIRSIVYTEDFSQFNLEQQREDFFKKREEFSEASYVSTLTDTPTIIKHRFNLSDEEMRRLFPNDLAYLLLGAGREIKIPVSSLVNANSIKQVSLAGKPLVFYEASTERIILKGRGSTMTIPYVASALSRAGFPKLLEEISPGEWILRGGVLYVSDGVTLAIDKQNVKKLKIRSDAEGFSYIQTYNGSLLIDGVEITSWDEKANGPDMNYDDGRAFILAKQSGRMDIINSDIGHLGYPLHVKVATRSQGGGIYGISWKINDGTFGKSLLTGSASGNRIHDNYYGMYSFGAVGLIIKNNEVFNNVQYGIDPHDDSSNLLIENNYVHDNGNHGIIGSKRVVYSTIRNNISINNKLHGIMLHEKSNYNLVENNIVSGNVDGMAIYDSSYNLVAGNTFNKNTSGIRINKESSRNFLEKNSLLGNSRGIFIYDNSGENVAYDNLMKDNAQDVAIKQASANVIYDTDGWKDSGIKMKLDDASLKTNFIKEPAAP